MHKSKSPATSTCALSFIRVAKIKMSIFAKIILFGMCLCFVVKSVKGKGNDVDYYTSQHGLQQLASAERDIAAAVMSYVSACERRLEVAKRFLSDYETSGINFNSSQAAPSTSSSVASRQTDLMIDSANMALPVTAHPLRAYRLLRRYVKDLPALEKEMRSDDERKFLKLTEKIKSKLTFPTQKDMKGATEGILRVHDTYDINIDEFTSGNFYGLNTNTSMSAADCFFIGVYALESTILTRAIQWLERSYKLAGNENDTTISLKEVRVKLEEAISQHNEALKSRSGNPYLFTKPVKLEDALKRKRERQRILESDKHVMRTNLVDLTNFAALCAGKDLRGSAETSRLKCWYNSETPLTVLDPLKVERHSWQPKVLQFHDIIGAHTMRKIIASATDTMSRSQVYSKSSAESKMISSSRTSTSTWLRDKDKYATVKELRTVYRRLEDFTGLKILDEGASEDLQVSCYGIAGHFNPHLDTIFNSVDKNSLGKEEILKGERLATVMFYLSEVARGGRTAFSRIGVSVEPIKGSAIFWYNTDENDKPEQLSLHGGCPILYGNKCVANKWIRSNAQDRKCPKSKT